MKPPLINWNISAANIREKEILKKYRPKVISTYKEGGIKITVYEEKEGISECMSNTVRLI